MDPREENARMLDPQRFQIAKEMSYMPGGPMMNNPMNVTNMSPQLGSMDGVNQYPYGDSGVEMDSRMGAVGPSQNSGMPQNLVMGTGFNRNTPYNAQQQPQSAAQEPMEGMRLGQDAMTRGLNANQFMGMMGQSTPLPGNPTMMQGAQTNATLGLVGFQNLEGNGGPPTGAPGGGPAGAPDGGVQPPGSTPTKIGKKRGKK